MEKLKLTFITSQQIRSNIYCILHAIRNTPGTAFHTIKQKKLRLMISEENTLIKRLEELRKFLLKKKYPPTLIDDSITKIKCLNRPAFLKAHENNDKDNSQIPYVTTFNPHNPEIYPEIFKNKSLLSRDNRLKTIFKNKSFLKSKRQPPSLKKLLTKA